MSKKEKKKVVDTLVDQEVLDIPEEEIYTYQVEGLAPPHINKEYKNYGIKKAIFVLVIIVAVSLSMYFSVRVVHSEPFEYKQLSPGTYQLTQFSNTGFIKELYIDYVSEVEYIEGNNDPQTNFVIQKDKNKKVTSIREYAFNCDGALETVYIGKDVTFIDGKAFYSCWTLKAFEVDENNPNYCDIDGVLYTKDKKTVVCYPCDHDQYLREKYGYESELFVETKETDPELWQKYTDEVMTYVLPSTVENVGELCFNYSNLATVYVPEGLKRIETLGFFEMPNFANFYTYVADSPVEDTVLSAVDGKKIYLSLPDGLEYIGSDAFSYDQALTYMFIPESVTYVGHHAFWDTVYKADGELKGITVLNVELSEEKFKDKAELGDQWVPQYDKNLLRKIDVEYGSTRKTIQ